ncbi:MAG TPA: ATP-binding cassette domain-containing protein, partial [Thermoanaerobaculia bacterium]
AITLGGMPLREVNAAQWRRRCGVVMQDGYIFSDTLERNIALGLETYDPARILYVCSLARLDDLLARLVDGIETRIGPNGHELSAGERQRVLIARALFKDPDVFIFDEATSSLDGANERELLQNLETALAGKTVITIAHRLSTVINADRIVVLENGRLSEHGTHSELVSSRSTYYDLIRNQLELGR